MARSDAILKRLLQLHPKVMDLSLDRMHRILEQLGNPHLQIPPVVHIAGTNGKGSTLTYLRTGLEAAGYAVHAYTSPHLVRFHERIYLGGPGQGELIDEEELCALLLECEEVNDGAAITFFEITTAAAFLAFSRCRADICLLEVGLGGRLDATNVIDAPALTVITPVDLDHQAYLGDTIEAIAAEKAGIMKPQVPCVIGPQSDAGRAVMEAVAEKVHAPLVIANQDFQAYEEHGRLVYQDDAGLLDLPLPALAGRFQLENAGTAIAALRALDGFALSEKHVEQAVSQASWPARMQLLDQGPIAAMLPEGSEVWVDGGHNASAGRAIATSLADLEDRVSRPTVLVLGMLASRTPADFLAPFEGLISSIIATPIDDEPGAMSAQELAAACAGLDMDVQVASDVEHAVRLAGSSGEPVRLLVAGSLYLAGHLLALNAGMAKVGPSGSPIRPER